MRFLLIVARSGQAGWKGQDDHKRQRGGKAEDEGPGHNAHAGREHQAELGADHQSRRADESGPSGEHLVPQRLAHPGERWIQRRHAGVVDQHVDLAGLRQYVLDARLDRRVVAYVQLHGLDAELPQGGSGLVVLVFQTAH